MDLTIKPKLLTACTFILGIAGCSTAPQSAQENVEIKRLVVFGDSNLDTGNLSRMTNSELPTRPNWEGRNSNGPVVVEYLSKNLNAKLENYAVSGATTGTSNIVPKIVPKYANVEFIGVDWQISEFKKTGGRLGQGVVVVLWAGSNDIFGVKRQDRSGLDARIAAAAKNVENALLQLHAAGAKRVVFSTRTPREIIGNDNDLNGVDLNASLINTIKHVKATTGMDIVLYDAYARVSDMMTNPAKYGFSDARSLCFNVPACASDTYESGHSVANGYVNWDSAHKTTRVHKVMADEIQVLLRN